ncbi:hypothetical protein BT69DRAFT_1296656 [Atractiella rhizophila]|nr:hypothetical protein BT69DRAFT_1296656 [Atractiella rhizophila]
MPTAMSLAALLSFMGTVFAEQITNVPISFNWAAGAADTSRSFPSCGDVSIDIYPVDNPNPAPRAPYYLLIYPIGGVPEVVTVGQAGTTFHWTANYAAGTQVLLAMADSNGISGGISTAIYSVTSSANQSCLQTNPSPTSTETVTVPTEPNPPQCEDLSISWTNTQVSGPYTITIVRTGAAPVNITGVTGTSYAWKNTIQTGGQAIIAISNNNNVYLPTSDLFTSGTGNAACLSGGSQTTSSSGSSPTGGSGSGNGSGIGGGSGSDSKGSSSVGAIAGGVAAGAAVVVLAAGVWWFLRRRKNRQSLASLSEKKGSYYNHSPAGHSGEHLDPQNGEPYGYGHSHVPSYSNSYAPSAYASTEHHSNGRPSSAGGLSEGYQSTHGYPPIPSPVGPNQYPLPAAGRRTSAGRFFVTNPDGGADGGPTDPRRGSATKAALTAELNFPNNSRRVVHAQDAGRVGEEGEVEELPPVYRDTRQPTPVPPEDGNAVASGSGSHNRDGSAVASGSGSGH